MIWAHADNLAALASRPARRDESRSPERIVAARWGGPLGRMPGSAATRCLPPCERCVCVGPREPTTEVAIRKMGNSQGVPIPKPILAPVGLEGTAELQVRDGVSEIRAIRRCPREGRPDDARRLAGQGCDALVWPEVANEGDDERVWW